MDSASISSLRPADNAMPALPSGDKAKVRFVAQQLEAIMITHMLKESRGNGTAFLDKSMAGGMFRDMLDEELAQNMSKVGAFGLANTFEREMTPRLEAEAKLRLLKETGKTEDKAEAAPAVQATETPKVQE